MNSYKNKTHNNNINNFNYYNKTTSVQLGCDLVLKQLLQFSFINNFNNLKVYGGQFNTHRLPGKTQMAWFLSLYRTYTPGQ